jgi:hypothetical protein
VGGASTVPIAVVQFSDRMDAMTISEGLILI